MLEENNPGFLVDPIGMPTAHAEAFKRVAMGQGCVIMIRATGPTCRGPLEEGYDTKGYRIHGKSCDWGPMAGFVLRDPRLNKGGVAKEIFNRKKHHEALEADEENQGWKASTTPLVISEERRQWLVTNEKIAVQLKGGRWDGTASQKGVTFKYSLISEGPALWGVYFDNTDPNRTFRQERGSTVVRYHRKWGSRYEPMLAMTNPPEHRQFPGENYLNAVTGDYDLFAVWAYVKNYDASPFGDDYRPLGTTRGHTGPERANIDYLERNFADHFQTSARPVPNGHRDPNEGRQGPTHNQGTKLGNITYRIYLVGQLVNSLIGRHVVWHSDESARPFLDEVDLPVIAFTPAGKYMSIRTIRDFKAFIALCNLARIRVTLSNAWTQEPTEEYPSRLGSAYAGYVPDDTIRSIVPAWYNR